MNKRLQNIMVMILSLFVICGTVGYAIYSNSLANTRTTVEVNVEKWNVHFKNGSYKVLDSSSIINEYVPNLTDPNLNTKISATMGANDIFDFVVAVENEGTMDALVKGIELTGDVDGLEYSYTWYGKAYTKQTIPVEFVESPIDLNKDKLEKNTIRNIKIHISANETAELKDRNLGLKLDFSK